MSANQDPFDAMLLTERPTTVVTQATTLHDTMPDPYESPETEEDELEGLGAEADLLKATIMAPDAATAAKMVADALVKPAPVAAPTPTPSNTGKILGMSLGTAALVGLGVYLLMRKR